MVEVDPEEDLDCVAGAHSEEEVVQEVVSEEGVDSEEEVPSEDGDAEMENQMVKLRKRNPKPLLSRKRLRL